MALIFIQNKNCLIELWFSFESKVVLYVHVNENENGSVRARMDFDSNRKLVYEMVPIGSDWFLLMVRTEEMSCRPGDRGVPAGNVLQVEMYSFVRTYYRTTEQNWEQAQ